MVRTTKKDWIQPDHNIPQCTHKADARFDYRLVEYPLREKEKWRGVREILTGDRFPDDTHRSWASTRIRDIEADIANAGEHIRRLERHRARLHRDLIALSSTLAPVRALPRDVLFEIFACLVRQHGSTVDPDAAPWALLKVCHQWRIIALSSPSLWATMRIITKPSLVYGGPHNIIAALVKHSLSTSRAVPLSITLDLDSLRLPENIVTKLLSTLAAHRSRVRALTFYSERIDTYPRPAVHRDSNGLFIREFLGTAGACPQLEKLDMLGPGESETRPALRSAPSLKQVRDLVLYKTDDQHPPTDTFITPAMTHFYCNVCSIDDISVVGRMPRLVELHVLITPGARPSVPNEPVKHAGVRYFGVRRYEALNYITLPSLRVLAITEGSRHVFNSPPQLTGAIENFISRSNCVLRALVVSDEYVNAGLVKIGGLQDLDTLAIHTGAGLHYGSEDFLDRAIEVIASSPQLPKVDRLIILNHLKLDGTSLGKIYNRITTILGARRNKFGGRIQTIEIWDGQAEGGKSSIHELFEGLKIKDDGRKWEPRIYADELNPPKGSGMWAWWSDIVPCV